MGHKGTTFLDLHVHGAVNVTSPARAGSTARNATSHAPAQLITAASFATSTIFTQLTPSPAPIRRESSRLSSTVTRGAHLSQDHFTASTGFPKLIAARTFLPGASCVRASGDTDNIGAQDACTAALARLAGKLARIGCLLVFLIFLPPNVLGEARSAATFSTRWLGKGRCRDDALRRARSVAGALRGERSGPPNIRSPHHFHQPRVNTRVIPLLRQE